MMKMRGNISEKNRNTVGLSSNNVFLDSQAYSLDMLTYWLKKVSLEDVYHSEDYIF